ncbi:MAG: hypothetical protein IT317_07505 [Anaerolineales bacterium]|nr:hypothetical protein [Anaerolineales bacterium]
MPPIKTTVSCPNCRQPVPATLEQVFDLYADPSAKQRFMSGRFNLIQCPNCGYQGQYPTPLLYHDPDKETLLTYVPMELGLPANEQEKLVGRLMNDVIKNLPQEKRKGYLLRPKQAFTLQGMLESVLEGEGITKEMLDAQRSKVTFLQSLLSAPEAGWPDMIKQSDNLVDSTLFQLLSASAEATAQGGNQAGAQKMLALQNALLTNSSFGAKVRARQQTLESVGRELQALGKQLTADKLLELATGTTDEDRLAALVSYARPGMDYAFFEALTRRIDRAAEADKARLTKTRETLLALTAEADKATQAQMAEATELLRTLLEAPDLQQAIQENLARIDDTFLAVLNVNIEAAEKAKRQEVAQRLTEINDAIAAVMQASAPPELRLVNELLQMETDEAAVAALKSRSGEVTQQLLDAMTYVGDTLRQQGQTALADRVDKLQGEAMGALMKANWAK